jgi:hypothetical protein
MVVVAAWRMMAGQAGKSNDSGGDAGGGLARLFGEKGCCSAVACC